VNGRAGEEVALCANPGGSPVIAELRVIQRQLHEPLERHSSACHLVADGVDEPRIADRGAPGIEVKRHDLSFAPTADRMRMFAILKRMRILVLGHSDSGGRQLADRSQAWPWLVAERLEQATGKAVEIDHRELSPIRPGTAEFVAQLVDGTEPGVVCVAVNPFWFAGATVSLRVQQRYGPQVAGRYRRIEQAFDRHTRSGRLKRPLNRFARRVTRRVVGTAVPGSLEQVRTSYEDILTRLSQFEQLPVLVMAGNRLPEWTAKNAALRKQIDDFVSAMEVTVRRHRFAWFDTETTFAGEPRSKHLFADGIHRNEYGHLRHADGVFPVVAALADLELVRA
jgi:lysophospholipase L1-like esterase